MSFFAMSRLTRLDVKWARNHAGNNHLLNKEHSNPNYEIIMVAAGPIYLQVESRKMELKSGDFLILKPWERHQSWKTTHSDANFFWVQFTADPLLGEKTLQFDDSEQHLQPQDLRTNNTNAVDQIILPQFCQNIKQFELLSLFEKLIQTLSHPKGYFRFRSSLLLSQILEMIANNLLSNKQHPLYIPDSFIIYRKLVELLDETYHANLDKEVIEEYMERTYEYLCQIFKKYSGTTIVKYTNMLRIQKAKFLMQDTSKSINQISEEVGVVDSLYFSKLFKKLEGCSPSEFRQQNVILGKSEASV
ncbi:putative HTH-type transcriptional regulator YisR [Paenibacillus baekrokdamisoli]|uniref:Putative HTH-type transcriptional regulator YisR n=1 Tax=Paenibacillus baekrokdamisoli TaxID=1712516 RepID=A0A3G9J191_9BACL|nr:helix-turn-helix domain-containing protein [Paenibacillus baekrokdamisoli]MBB3069476.1 YesN/AraC family two-component response regulator [Paenibacillus baekrokdamisoli]BBH24950.1 putative HTH-type transcriptional regulator YisR [Paenibacillus baekrokdamisoli]